MRKGLVVGIILLFISIIIFSVNAEQIRNTSFLSFDGKIFYVGGNGPGNYSKIQDAIDASADGDTVFVYDDSSPYNENIRLDKMIALIGENKETTDINGVITISRDFVALRGFTLKGPDWYHDGIILNANNSIFSNLSIVNVGYALQVSNSNNNIFRDIEISSGRDCINFINSNDNLIQRLNIINSYKRKADFYKSHRNTITDSIISYGVVRLSRSNNNTVIHNTFLSAAGFSLDNAYDNIIKENTFVTPCVESTQSHRNIVQNNLVSGKPLVYLENEHNQVVEDAGQVILIRCGKMIVQHLQIISNGTGKSISLEETTNSIIRDNVLSGGDYGVYIDISVKNQIMNNTIENTQYGIADQGGIFNVYSNNLMQDNHYNGLILFESIFVKVEGNTIINNEVGVEIDLGIGNTIFGNTITNNSNGITLGDTAFNKVKNNNFIKNKVDAYFENALRTHWERNYWEKLLPIPKIIHGSIILQSPVNPYDEIVIPFINVDKLPRLVPYKNT